MKAFDGSKAGLSRLWVEEGEQREGVIAEVAPLLPVPRTYSFAVPAAMEARVALGQRVKVPVGRRGRPVVGFVVQLDRGIWDNTLRPIHSLVDEQSYLNAELIALGREIAAHYVCPLGQTLKAITPEGVRRQRGFKTVRFVEFISESGQSAEDADTQGESEKNKARARAPRITAPRRAVLDLLQAGTEPIPIERIVEETGVSTAVIRSMAAAGMIRIKPRKIMPEETSPEENLCEPEFTLNEEQRTALAGIEESVAAGRFCVTLLFGVSGSGKTEVYLHAMRRVLEQGRQAILLVPEIVLTTQLAGRLASRFSHVALFHSGLTEAERSIAWQEVAAGRRNVVIGTRSAVFAPCPDLGLICVDEEQEPSFKNLQAPRFHVRDAAILRARHLGIPVVLGSATPAVETWYRSAHHPDYARVTIRRRIRDLPMPRVTLVDMNEEFATCGAKVVLSRAASRLLGETLSRGEQAVMLVNRRGYAGRLVCATCGTRVLCPHCSVGLVMHSATGTALCHYCRHRIVIPTTCSNLGCGGKLIFQGVGTQRAEDVLKSLFPAARVQRVDSDIMRHRAQYQQIVDDFEARRIDVLVGTQMIAKGLDFPFVSFVGVLHADSPAMAADFRAAERLFQLITQVAGRAGRADAPGRVVVQTTMPELPALRFALTHDYEAFAVAELEARRNVGWPPFRRVARAVFMHPREERAAGEASALAERTRAAAAELELDGVDLLGPSPCALPRLRGRYRYELLIRAPGAITLRRLLHHLEQQGALRAKAGTMLLDVDPVSLT